MLATHNFHSGEISIVKIQAIRTSSNPPPKIRTKPPPFEPPKSLTSRDKETHQLSVIYRWRSEVDL
jgi:hypothetical protein